MKVYIESDINKIMASNREWLDEVFPDRLPEVVFKKLEEELEELKSEPMNAWEYADVLICLLDLLDLYGFDPAKLIHHKMRINRQRKWRMIGGVLKHVEDTGHTESGGHD